MWTDEKKPIAIAALVGFLVPFGLGFFVMLFFSAKDTPWVHFFAFQLPVLLCPAWALGDGSAFWFFTMPFWNALTYATIAFLWLKAREFTSDWQSISLPEHSGWLYGSLTFGSGFQK
jgi:hypothetical protein